MNQNRTIKSLKCQKFVVFGYFERSKGFQIEISYTCLIINLLINASNYHTLFLVFAVVVSFFPVRSQLGASLVTGGGTSPLNEERKEVY